MIFVTLGTQKQQFTRVLDLIEKSKIFQEDEIIVQAGHTKYESNKMTILDFISYEEVEKYIEESELVICHGGVGSIFTALQKNKKILVVPRLSKYGEHINDHQLEICEQLEKDGYITYLRDGEEFDQIVQKLLKKENKIYQSDTSFLNILRKEI